MRGRSLGWRYGATHYCQLIRDENKVKRMEYSRRCLLESETFDDVIFTDETKIQLQSNVSRSSWKLGSAKKLKPRPKHPYQVCGFLISAVFNGVISIYFNHTFFYSILFHHCFQVYAWAGISRRGATPITIFVGIMDSTFYQQILERTLKPFLQDRFPDGHRFYQDNDPKHTSKATEEWLANNGINWWRSPPESPVRLTILKSTFLFKKKKLIMNKKVFLIFLSLHYSIQDLNPIENIWAHLKWHLRKNAKPRTKEELVDAIQRYWATITPEFCQRYIDHLQKVLPVVVERKGAASGY